VMRAVVLARGLGTRMRAADPEAALTAEQRRAADAGLKAMIPVHGRPFMDYILSGLADAGLTRVALVVAPDHAALRHYYEHERPPARVTLDFIVQREPHGTADAVLAAEAWTAGDGFLVMNGDNLYPVDGLSALARLDEPGLLVFDRHELVRSGNIPAERVHAFATVDVGADGYLSAIVEKPPAGSAAPGPWISMNCWRFDAGIFRPCREVPMSPRGEFELPEAVGVAIRAGMKLRAVPAHGPVLDLSRRADAAAIARHLDAVAPCP
jgi:dTDP-glucose pyrophosphorylase